MNAAAKNPRSPRAHLNMREVARHLGLSVTTVSFVLNNRPGIAQATRDRVIKAVAELGYTPSLVGKAINRKRSGVVGVVVPVSSGAIFPQIVDGVNDAAEKISQPIFVGYSQDRSAIEAKTLRMYSQLSVDGIIIATAPDSENAALLQQAYDHGMAIVQIERYRSGVPGAFVGSDNRTAAYDETRRLLEQGHRQIACVLNSIPHSVNDEHQLGYAAALREAGITAQPQWTRFLSPRAADFTPRTDAFRREIVAFLSEPGAPRAMLWCLGQVHVLVEALRELNLTNGRDIHIILFDAEPASDLCGQRFVNVMQDGVAVGRAAFQVLAKQAALTHAEREAQSRMELRIPCQRIELHGIRPLPA